MLDAKEVLSNVTPEVVVNIMAENGSRVYNRTVDRRTQQQCLWFQTICHGGDSHKLCYFTETKEFYCYTNCGKMSFYDLIKRIRNIKSDKFYDAVKYVAQKTGKSYNSNRIGIGGKDRELVEDLNEMEELSEKRNRKDKKEEFNSKIYDDKILNYFDPYTFYEGWIKDGISIKSMYKFNIRWYELEKHIIIPHYNINGELVGIRRRSLKPEDEKRKYMPEYIDGILYDHPLGLNLYGLYENQEAIKRYKRAIIVEGEKSVLLSDTYYGRKSCTVATCGFNISDWQLNTLLKLGVEEIILGFDKDYDITKENVYKKNKKDLIGFENYKKRLQVLCERIAPYCDTYILLDKKNLLKIKDAPFDEGKDIFEMLMKAKKQVTTDSFKE